MAMSETILVVNPYSGKKGKDSEEILPRLKHSAENYGTVLVPDGIEELKNQLKPLLKKKPKLLAVFGGDGSIYQVINILFETLKPSSFPYFLPLRGGTMNCIADDVGSLGPADQIFQRVVKRLESGHLPTIKRGVLQCEFSTQKEKEIHYGFTYASGLPYKGMLEAYNIQPTVFSVANLIFKGIFFPSIRKRIASLEKMSIKLRDEDLGERFYLGTLCSTLSTSVAGFKPFVLSIQKREKEFNFLSTSYRITQLAPKFYTILWGKRTHLLNPDFYFNRVTPEMTLESDSGFTLDGEIFMLEEPNTVCLKVAGVLEFPKVPFGRKFFPH